MWDESRFFLYSIKVEDGYVDRNIQNVEGRFESVAKTAVPGENIILHIGICNIPEGKEFSKWIVKMEMLH